MTKLHYIGFTDQELAVLNQVLPQQPYGLVASLIASINGQLAAEAAKDEDGEAADG